MPEETKELCAADGVGPLFERTYAAAITGASCTPEEAIRIIRARFVTFAPAETAAFEREGREEGLLEPGDELCIRIALAGRCKVRVAGVDDRSLTLRTLRGHPEAGRITFSADHDDQGRLLFQIRSRARASGVIPFVGFLVLGKQMQARCWIRFIKHVAEACGGQIEGQIRVETRRVDEEPADRIGDEAATLA